MVSTSTVRACAIYTYPQNMEMTQYRMARNLCGTKFLRFSRICLRPQNFVIVVLCALCFVIVEPRKIFREIFASGQSAKILARENYSPYGINWNSWNVGRYIVNRKLLIMPTCIFVRLPVTLRLSNGTQTQAESTVFLRSDAAATSFFTTRFCAATI